MYDEKLRIVRGSLALFARRIGEAAASHRARKWLRRVAHPGEAEIPVRARSAQMYGLLASRIRGAAQETRPLPGAPVLGDGVTIVIPSRNGRELLENLLPPLVPQLVAGEIIVSDNGSTDDTIAWLASRYPAIEVIRSDSPLSFAKAVNAGVRAARFSHTLLLNNDMIVAPGFVDALRAPFHTIPDLFCTTAQIFFPPGIRREETGKAVWRRENLLDFPVRCDDPIPGEDMTWVLYGSGGCSLFDTQKLRALGGVSEVYEPAYVEDLDFGYRAWKRGWPSVFCAGAQVEHRHRATTSRYYTPAELEAFVETNYLRFLAHAISSPDLFRRLWLEAIRRLQFKAFAGEAAALDALRRIPRIAPQPAPPKAALSESEIFALGGGGVAVFPGHAGREKPVIVIASPYLPFPLSHGGAVRIYNLMKQAARDYTQVLLAFVGELETPPRELLDICAECVLVRRHGSHYRRDTPLPDVVEEFASESFRATIKQTVRRWKPGVVQLEFTQMAQYADACRPAKTILVEHDITFDLQRQLLATTTDPAARLELDKQFAKWTAFETAAWKSIDRVIAMSQKDVQAVVGAKQVVCIPNGVDTTRFQPSPVAPEPRRLLFIGSFAHLPNLLALEFFLRDVWPRLGNDFTLHVIAGARHDYFLDFYRTRAAIELAKPRIELEGFVSDVRPAYQRAELVLAPLTASAGTNIKVLEAMAMGRAVVSTTAGINGLDLHPGRDVMVADSAEEMAKKIRSLSADPGARHVIEEEARRTALGYDWQEIAKRQSAIYPIAAQSPHADSPA
jgi:GT2 family glycosyltransferase/glycosyltransferase involved in cell wall biosynthesis